MSWSRLVFWLFATILFLFLLLVGVSKFKTTNNNGSIALDITTEDDKIMNGLWYEGNGDLNNSYRVFDGLYKETKSNAYLLEKIRLSLLTNTRLKESEIELEKLHKMYPKDTKVIRLLMTLHLVQKNFDKVKAEAENLILLSQDKLDIDLASDALVSVNEPNRALAILNTLYNKDHDEEIAIKMATILYDMYREDKQAISLLERHDLLYQGSDELHDKLYNIYISSNNLNGAFVFANKIYATTKDWQYLNDIAMKYYGLHECDKAYNVMQTIYTDNSMNDQQLITNMNKINACVKAKIVKK